MSDNNKESLVIKGEDSESDDEQSFNSNINNQTNQKNTAQQQGNVIEGEAPESDDDIVSYSNASLSTAIEVSENYSSSSTSSPMHHPHYQQKRSNLPYINTNDNMDNSLLHNKLVERNILFWQHLNAFIQNTIATNSKQLLAADQLLIKSLVTIQSASKIIKQINENSTQLLQKSNDILTGNFLPKIYFKK